LQESLGFVTELKPQHGVICVSDNDHIASRIPPPPLDSPEIENVMQVEICQYW
jgi:hypothetical protein